MLGVGGCPGSQPVSDTHNPHLDLSKGNSQEQEEGTQEPTSRA